MDMHFDQAIFGAGCSNRQNQTSKVGILGGLGQTYREVGDTELHTVRPLSPPSLFFFAALLAKPKPLEEEERILAKQ